MSEQAYETLQQFRTELVELLEEVRAAEQDAQQGIPRPHPDEPDPLYYARRKLEQGLEKFDETFDEMDPESCDASSGLSAADNAMHFYSHAAKWFDIDEDDEDAESLPDGVTNVGDYLQERYREGVKQFYDAHLAL